MTDCVLIKICSVCFTKEEILHVREVIYEELEYFIWSFHPRNKKVRIFLILGLYLSFRISQHIYSLFSLTCNAVCRAPQFWREQVNCKL